MELYEYLLLIVVWIMGAVYGWNARERYAKKIIERFISQFPEQDNDGSDSVIQISIERHNGVFYVYDKNNNDFMGQGRTRKELEDALAKRYPEKRFAATTENLKVFNESL